MPVISINVGIRRTVTSILPSILHTPFMNNEHIIGNVMTKMYMIYVVLKHMVENMRRTWLKTCEYSCKCKSSHNIPKYVAHIF